MNQQVRAVFARALLVMFCSACASTTHVAPNQRWSVEVESNLQRLVHQADTDGDKRITIQDRATTFQLTELNGTRHSVQGVYPLSVLIQELGMAQSAGKTTIQLASDTILENPVDRTSRMIRERFWAGLSRTIDRKGLPVTLPDPKMPSADGYRYLYVPQSDRAAYRYYKALEASEPSLKMKVLPVPQPITQAFLDGLDGKHGILALHSKMGKDGELVGSPFVVPGGRFNVMYGWDSYFITLGLLQDGKIDESRAMVDNHVYQVVQYGRVLNGNRTYYITRSQPPFLAAMTLAVYEKLPKTPESKAWLKAGLLAAIREYREQWAAAPRLDEKSGLSRYWGVGKGPCPEVNQPKIYEPVLGPPAAKRGLTIVEFKKQFIAGKIQDPELDKYFLDDRALRESGHDRTYRFDDRTSDFLTVDLNSLLYKVESDVAGAIEKQFGGKLGTETAAAWRLKADKRKQAVNALLWDETAGLFFDFDQVQNRRSKYISATTFYPLWAGLATPEQARRVMAKARTSLVENCGLAATAEISRGPITEDHPKRQWDYPNGWAPHQMLAWEGLRNYGLHDDAADLAYRWLYGITKNVRDFNGTVPEKLDMKECSQQMSAGIQFDNVGTEFKYATHEGFGWMNASYQVGLTFLPPARLDDLRRLKAPY